MLEIYDLRTEYLKAPLGIDAEKPRLSWKIRCSESNVLQEAYAITASSDPNGQNVIWASGKIFSDASQHVLWDGPKLSSGEKIFWKVEVEANGSKAISLTASYEMGLLKPEDWLAKWIEPEEEVDPDAFKPSPYLRREFEVKPGCVSARIYQSAHGLYEFWINGKRGTEDVFKPGFTSYYHRTQYQVYDITSLLKTGQNSWSVTLGDGWWRGTTGGLHRNNFGYKLSYIGQIILTYRDGSKQMIISDEKFRTSTGGLLKSDMKEGDVFDARKEPLGWKNVGFDDRGWRFVNVLSNDKNFMSNLIASRSVPVREKESFNAEVIRTPNGEVVLNFGQNIAGYVSMKLRGCHPGQKISLVHGETLDEEGNFTQKNIQTIRPDTKLQIVDYIAKGDDLEEYCPTFSVFGFQYVLIKGYEGEILPNDFVAFAVYSNLEETGEFTCSNPLINQLVQNSRWSQKGNFMDVPTDCPTRERSPWTGDSQIYVRTAADFMNVYPFFEKWLLDLRVEQFENGKVPNTVPSTLSIHHLCERIRKRKLLDKIENPNIKKLTEMTIGDPKTGSIADGSAGWGDTATITPYTLYLCYGDRRILENQYDSARKWVQYIINAAAEINPNYADLPYYQDPDDAKYVWDTGFHWGEWLEPDVIPTEGPEGLLKLLENPPYDVATMYFYYSAHLLSQMAAILGRQEDEQKYKTISEKVKQVYNKYFIQDDGTIKKGRQAPNVRALAFDLVAERKKKAVASKLAEMVVENGYRLNTGFLATPFLLHVLADHGYTDLAFKLLEQEESPSWLFNVKAGATTILEDWQGYEKCKASFNHYSFGAVCNFLFAGVAGIQPELKHPGYKHFLIKPIIGGTLTEAHAKYECSYGMIESAWQLKGDSALYRFVVPVNTSATAMLPAPESALAVVRLTFPDATFEKDRIVFQIGSGMWQVSAPMNLQAC